ncbi:oligosaccharide repeat unit polymerase [Sulfitobacter sp. W002]|uniref:O-antigen polymerase n=1 Tax=Sulfitobacter sp. W002 TaxID=2867024 RepID=UPI0021A71966|nr:O-antigen polymerase [Sulfitobacter sp. W002]UWR30448.1 oligosaccharide repeat unit polymerase [Sulfitobacter sp. W002]
MDTFILAYAVIFFFGLAIMLRCGIRNARGVFIIYFSAGCVYPYIVFSTEGVIPTFLRSFLDLSITPYVGFIATLAFLITAASSAFSLRPIHYDVSPMRIRVSRLETLCFFALIFFAIYVALSVAYAGSVQNALLAAYARVRTNSTLANIRSIFFWGNIVFSTFAFYGMRFSKPRFRTRALVLFSLLTAAILSLVDGGRAVFILFLLSLAAPELLRARTISLFIFGLVGGAVVLGVSYLMLSWRYAAQSAQILSDGGFSLAGALNGLEFIDHIQVSIQYAERFGYNLGETYLNAALSFLPRALFPSKAVPLAAQVRGYLFGDETGGIPPGLFGEAYISFGIVGVILISFIFGRALLASSTLCKRAVHANCPVRFAMAGIMVPLIGFTLVRGGLDIGVLRVGLPFFWIYISVLMATNKSNGSRNRLGLRSNQISIYR